MSRARHRNESYNLTFKLTEDTGEEDLGDFGYTSDGYVVGESEKFAQAMRDCLSEFIENSVTNEAFVNTKGVRKKTHNDHCLGNVKGRKSSKTNIYYDFVNRKDYIAREKNLINGFNNTKLILNNFTDIVDVNKKFKKFFEGDKHLLCTTSCGLKNNNGVIALGLHSYASDVTTNYTNGNTIDLFILTPGNTQKTITYYPVDSYYLQTILNNIISKCGIKNALKN